MRAQRRLPKQGNQKSNVISIGERRPGLIGRYRSADERRAEGRALRDVVPRESHGHWKAPSDRRSNVRRTRRHARELNTGSRKPAHEPLPSMTFLS